MCFFWRKKKNNKVCKENENKDESALVRLITVHNSYELGVAESILKDNQIPYIVRETGAGGFLKITTGALLTDADIMIERSYLDKAQELIYMLNNDETAEKQNG